MKTFKVPRPSQEHIQKMLIKAKETNKRQLEILEMSGDILSKIETPFNHKSNLSYNVKDLSNERHSNNESD